MMTIDHAMFKAVKLFNQKQHVNPNIKDNNRKLTMNPNNMLTITAKYFKCKFQDDNIENIAAF